MTKLLLITPRVSEKSFGLSKERQTFTFEVPAKATKQQVASAVKEQFNVTVVDVNILTAKGKAKRSYRKRTRPTTGRRSDVKKAYVRLKDGDTIAQFAAMAEEPKEEKKK